MILTRDRGNRMWGGDGVSGGGGGGVSSSQLAGMLIGYATETWVDEHYISIDFFSRLFQAHGTENGSEIDVMPNDLETTITSVESMFGFWTNLYISALGSNGAAPAGISLGMLTDVNISGTPIAGQVLTYDAATQKWVNGNGGASSIATLTDVTLTSLGANQILIYDANTQKWVNSSVKTINGYSILGSGNIEISGTGGGTRWLDAYVSGRPNTINWLYGDDRLRYFIVSNNVPGTPPMGNSMGLHFSWDNTGGYEAQMAIGHNDHRRIQFRCMNIGTWMEWSTVQDSSHMIQITLESDRQVLMDLCNYSANPYGLIVSSTNSGALMMQSKRRGSSTEFFTLALNHEGGKVGVGTIEPVVKLHVIGAGRFGTTDDGIYVAASNTGQESAFGCIERISSGEALFLNYYNSGNVNICVGGGRVGIGGMADTHKLYVNGNIYSSQYGLFGGTSGIIIGGSWDSDPQNYGCIERTGDSFSKLYLQYFSSGSIIMCYGGGSIGIGVDNPSYKLHVAGTIYATGAITALSDARKKDITGEVGVTVEQIAHAPAVQFLWKDKERRKDGQQVGTLAQYWRTVLPEVVSDKGGELSMQYGVAALVSAIVTARKVVDHERRITELEKENERLKEEISQLRLN